MAKAKFGQMVELNQRMVDPDILGHAVRPHKVTVTLPSPKVFDLTPGKLAKADAPNTDRAQIANLTGVKWNS